MLCNFCQKEIHGGHACGASIKFNKQVKKYFKIKVKDVLSSWKEGNTSGAEELTKIFIKKFLKENGEYSHVVIERLSISGLVESIRILLKEAGVYTRSTAGRIQKIQKTMESRYGVINPGQLLHNKNKLIERNNAQVYKLSYHGEFESYSKKVEYLTRKNKKRLDPPKSDYYTLLPFQKEFESPDLMQGDLYPTIDHKLSVLYCFLNHIPAEECSSVSNLVWVFRHINALKGQMTETQFKSTLLLTIQPVLEKEFRERGWIKE